MRTDGPGKRRPAMAMPGSDGRAKARLPQIFDNRAFLASGHVASVGPDPLASG
jgi:hypothetical protein